MLQAYHVGLRRVPPCLPAVLQLRGMTLNLNEKSCNIRGRSRDDNLRLRPRINVFFFLDIDRSSSRQPVKHSVPHGKLVAYKSYI